MCLIHEDPPPVKVTTTTSATADNKKNPGTEPREIKVTPPRGAPGCAK